MRVEYLILELTIKTNYGNFYLHFSGPSVCNNLDEQLKSSSLRLFKKTMMKKCYVLMFSTGLVVLIYPLLITFYLIYTGPITN